MGGDEEVYAKTGPTAARIRIEGVTMSCWQMRGPLMPQGSRKPVRDPEALLAAYQTRRQEMNKLANGETRNQHLPQS